MQLPEPPDRGLIRLAIEQHHHIDVATGRTEVTGDQRPIDVDADQIPPPRKPIPETLEHQADVARKLHRILSLVVEAGAEVGVRGIVSVHNSGYTEDVDDSQNQLSVRDARAHFAELITRAQGGTPTIITRNGQPVAAVVPIEDFNVLEDAIDRYFAREADRDLAENPDAPTYSMSEVVAAIFEEEPGKGVA
jgi:prevent-host-death family protein